jgi:tyrosyl-tRNA synthetase
MKAFSVSTRRRRGREAIRPPTLDGRECSTKAGAKPVQWAATAAFGALLRFAPFILRDRAVVGSPLDELARRGLVAQVSDQERLDAHLRSASRTLYCGFDPTADSLHIGNLVPLLTLRRFQAYGHRPIALVGGATGLIGDPSFKQDERALNDRDQVEGFDLDGNNAGLVVNNLDWTAKLDVIGFLRDVGKHFSVNAMMQKESVRARLTQEDQGISFTEFSYMILQSMDYMELAKRYDCSLQIGGSDQWGNITSGMDLVRRTLGREAGNEAYALTVPLVTKADGTKFGKTESGSVWLDPARTSPYSFYQFWLNTADADAVDFLRLFTFLEESEIHELTDSIASEAHTRTAQRRLAEEVTLLVHGAEALGSAERISRALFQGALADLTAGDFEQLRLDGMACTQIDAQSAVITSVLADSGLAQSRGAARKLVESRGVSVNGEVVENVGEELTRSAALHGRYHLLRRGKKAWHLVVQG